MAHGLLFVVASLVVEHGPEGSRASGVAAPRLWRAGSVVVRHGFSCSWHVASSQSRD